MSGTQAASTLCHELDPDYAMAKLGLADAVKITKRTRDLRILQAFAADCGQYVLPLPDLEAGGDVTEHIIRCTKEFSDYLQAFSASMADGRVTDNELARCQKELGELVQTANGLLALAQRANSEVRSAAPLERVA